MTDVTLRTARLLLRQWREEDFPSFAAVYADAEQARYIGGPSKHDTAWRRMAAQIGHWALRGYGYWAVEEIETRRFVGCVGLWRSAGWPEMELGYWIVPDMQGKGYATEAGAAARDYAFTTLGADTLVSYIHPANEPSKHVAVRLGARYETTIELLDHGPHCVYRYPRPADHPAAGAPGAPGAPRDA